MSIVINNIFKHCTSDGRRLTLPKSPLERNEFLEVKVILIKAGGKWKGGNSQCFEFPFVAEPVRLLLEEGERPNFKQDNQFFETPMDVIELMNMHVDIYKGDRILEPSAGRFAIGHWLAKYCITYDRSPIDCYEANQYNQDYLKQQPSANLIGSDFLAATPPQDQDLYDAILANPPFANDADMDHIRHMTTFIKPTGIIVSIASTAWQKSPMKKAQDFRHFLLNQSRCQIIALDQSSFKASGTNVNACVVVINGSGY